MPCSFSSKEFSIPLRQGCSGSFTIILEWR